MIRLHWQTAQIPLIIQSNFYTVGTPQFQYNSNRNTILSYRLTVTANDMTVREICLQIISLSPSLPFFLHLPFFPFTFPPIFLSFVSTFSSPSLPAFISYFLLSQEIHLEGRLKGKHFAFSLVIVQKQKLKFPFIHLFGYNLLAYIITIFSYLDCYHSFK